MGTYLGKPGQPSAPVRVRTDLTERSVTRRPAQSLHQVHRVQHVHRAHPAPRHRPARRPPNWDPAKPAARRFNEAWRRFPMRRPAMSILGPQPSDWWESYLKRSIWSLRHPRAVWSPVTVKIAPPEPRGPPAAPPAEVITLAGSTALEKTPGPDPCAKETVLTALRENRKERVQLVEPLFAENLYPQSSETRPSAFKDLRRNGDLPSYLPQPGPLQRGRRPRNLDHALRQRSSCTSLNSLACKPPLGPLSAQRNAISSSYSSWREFSEPWKRSASPQTPDWPVKRPEKGRGSHSPALLASDKPLETSSSSEPPTPKVPRLLCDPRNSVPQTVGSALSAAFPAGKPDREKRAGSQQSGQAQEAASQARADSVSEKPSALSLPSLSEDTVPALASELTLERLKKGEQSPEPPLSPQPTADAVSVIQSPPKAPSPLTLLSGPLPGPPADSQPKAPLVLTPVSTTSPTMDTSWPPSAPEAEGSSRRPQSLGDDPGPPASGAVTLPPAATSADPTTKTIFGLPPSREFGGSSSSSASLTQRVSTYTFKPIFGAVETLPAGSMGTPLSLQQSLPPDPSATHHLLQGRVKPSSVAVAPSPPGTSKASASQSPLDLGRVNVPSATSCTVATSFTSHASLVGAPQIVCASFSPSTGFVFPSPLPPSVPTVHTVSVLSHVLPSAVPISSSTSTANLGHLGSPLSASAVITPQQPAWLPSMSSATPSLAVSPQSAPRPPFPLSMGTTSQPAVGSAPDQKPRAPPATFPKPDFNRTMNLSTSVQPAGSSAAGFPFHQTGAAGLGAVSLVPHSGAGGSVFGSTAPRPFAFGGLETPMECGESGTSGIAPDMSSTVGAGMFNVGPMPPSGTMGLVMPFGGGWSQSTPGLGSQSSAFASGGVSLSAGKITFGGLVIAPFAQNTTGPGPVMQGNSLGAGVPASPAQGSLSRGPFRSSAPSFSIGTKSKTPKNREQGHARRHHGHKK